jgi:sugar-specific transcriptional regulator TrmB
MSVDKLLKKRVVKFLEHLDINESQATAYLYLIEHGPQTVLALSRGLTTGRTKLYPLLELLAERQLITVHERHYGTTYEALPLSALEYLVFEKENRASELRAHLPMVTKVMEQFQYQLPTNSKILEYHGVDGLKQMNFNLTKAHGEFRVFELSSLSKHLGSHFAEKNRQIYADNKVTSYDLTNNPDWNLVTKVTQYESLSKARYIDPGIFTIHFESYIYNNCVALLSYEKEDIFGVEIYNEKLASQQKQLFDLVWSRANIIKD